LPAIFTHSHIYSALNQQCNIGVTVNLKSVHEIAKAIEDLLLDPNELNQKSEQGLYWSQNLYNWEKEYAKLEKFYLHLNHSIRIN
jgi:glycosyltransferase involved in cell wall biosynthesis